MIVLLKRKPGTTMAEFQSYYEKYHAPLVIGSNPLLRKFVRNYLSGVGNEMYPEDAETPFDCVTEAWFDSEADYQRSVAGILNPEKAREIAEDEEQFLDRDATRWYTAIERESALNPVDR